jgi:hypothetical protein
MPNIYLRLAHKTPVTTDAKAMLAQTFTGINRPRIPRLVNLAKLPPLGVEGPQKWDWKDDAGVPAFGGWDVSEVGVVLGALTHPC